MGVIETLDLPRLRLAKYPDPVLRQFCRELDGFGDALERLAARMLDIMYAMHGVGLAGPQVGVPIRLFVCNPTGQSGEDETVCVNPRILDLDGHAVEEEGCLSVPGVSSRIKRAGRVKLAALDLRAEPFELVGEGLVARIFQHELDHLDGMLVIDRMSQVSKLANRQVLKELEAGYVRDAEK